MNLLSTKSKRIGDYEFTVRILGVREARGVYAKIAPMLSAFNDDELKSANASVLLFASIGQALSDDDLDFFIKTFGPQTTVDVGDGRVLTLNSQNAQDELFAGSLELLLEWLEFCIEVNFRGLIEKTSGVLQALEQKRGNGSPKAQPK